MRDENDFALLEDDPHNWQVDYPHENGNYCCKCFQCGCFFSGHKRRVQCRVCAEKVNKN